MIRRGLATPRADLYQQLAQTAFSPPPLTVIAPQGPWGATEQKTRLTVPNIDVAQSSNISVGFPLDQMKTERIGPLVSK